MFCLKKEKKKLEQNYHYAIRYTKHQESSMKLNKMAANLSEKRSQDFWKEVKNVEKLNLACSLVLMLQMDLLIYVMFL